MNTQANIKSYSKEITDSRLFELLPEVPEHIEAGFYGTIRVSQTGYGTWRIIVELDLNGSKVECGFTTHDEETILKVRGADRFAESDQDAARQYVTEEAIESNYNYIQDKIAAIEVDEDTTA